MAGGIPLDYDRFVDLWMQAVREQKNAHWVASEFGRTVESVKGLHGKLRKAGIPLPYLAFSGPRVRLTQEVIVRLTERVKKYDLG